jgi:parallel beta-helix repeat protein
VVPVESRTRVIKVSGALSDAVKIAQAGDVLELQARIYDEAFIEIENAGMPDAPITIRGAGAERSILNGRMTFRSTASHWIVEDIGVDMIDKPINDAVRLDPGSHHITIRRAHLRNGKGYGLRIGDDAHDVLIEQCEIDQFTNASTDAHGIGIQAVSNVTIRGNSIHNNSGDGIQSHTSDFLGNTLRARNIVIENNRIQNNGENGIDIKSTHGVRARNNLISGLRAAGGGDGIAIQVQYDAQDVTIMSNQIFDSAIGIEVTRGLKGGKDYPFAPSRVQIVGNLIRDLILDATNDKGNGTGIVVRGSSNVKVFHNTILRVARAGFYAGRGNNGEFVSELDLRNNVFDGGENDLDYNSDIDTLVGIVFDANHYVNARIRNRTLSEWTSRLRDVRASIGDPMIDSNYSPLVNSPLRDSGVDVGYNFDGAAPDRGWSEFIVSDTPVPTPQPTATINPALRVKTFMPIVRKK